MTSNSKYPEDWVITDLPEGLTFYNEYSIKLPKYMGSEHEIRETIEKLVDLVKENGYILEEEPNPYKKLIQIISKQIMMNIEPKERMKRLKILEDIMDILNPMEIK